jgi:hypothetical protein
MFSVPMKPTSLQLSITRLTARLPSLTRNSSTGGAPIVMHWEKRIGSAIGIWPLSDRTAARLTNGQMKEADLTGEMMRPFREARTRYWTFQA